MVVAGGVTPDAAPEVIVRRRKARGVPGTLDPSAINADTEQKSFNREDLDNGRIANPPTLQDFDMIYVPKAKKVMVSGEVQSPGSIVLLPGMTVIEAIQKAGGFKPTGSTTRIEISRYDPNQGKYVKVDGVTATTLVQANDSITVKKKIML
jgi:protein involved in polysaccharide export with SLBB domain